MLKKIKTTKQMRLDELIKYVWDNSVNEKRVFLGNHGQRVVFDNVGGFYPSGYAYSPDSTFTVEMEEEITEDTVFEWLVKIATNDDLYSIPNVKLGNIKSSTTKQIYALINGRLELVWENDEDE